MAQLFILPTALLTVGSMGPYQSPLVGAAYAGWQLTVTPGIGYPTTPGPVFSLFVDVSQDNGATWTQDAVANYVEGPWKDKTGATLTADTVIRWLGKTLPGSPQEAPILMAPTDLYRIRLSVTRACNCSIAMAGWM